MSLIEIANILISFVQSYMIYNFIYKIWKPRYGYIGSNILTFIIVMGTYVNGAYIQTKVPPAGVICGLGMAILYAIFALEGSVFQNIKRGILYFFVFSVLEMVTLFSLMFLISSAPWFQGTDDIDIVEIKVEKGVTSYRSFWILSKFRNCYITKYFN